MHIRAALLVVLAVSAAFPSAVRSQCGGASPAVATPESRGLTQLWPASLRPGTVDQLGLPANRDSSDFSGDTPTSAGFGHELFVSLDIVADRLFVAYKNTGISVWDIAGSAAENPQRLVYKDGLPPDSHWLCNSTFGEEDGWVEDVAAVQDPANADVVLIAVAARFPIGAAVWKYRLSTGTLTQLYQNVKTNRDATDVEIVVFNGRAYGFFANAPGGPFVLDLSTIAALPSGCYMNSDAWGSCATFTDTCPGGIDLGRVGTAAQASYLSVIERGGAVYMASTRGVNAGPYPFPEIWALNPANPGAATRKWLGTIKASHGLELFAKDGGYYLGVAETAVGAKRLAIYDVGACLDADGCASLPAPSYVNALSTVNTELSHHVTYSESNGRPFLYYGGFAGGLRGPAVERLIDLTNLGGSNALVEVTADGETYTDDCSPANAGVGYWSDVYAGNEFGYGNVAPRIGRFNDEYFYRATYGTLDVHVYTPPAGPEPIFADGFESGDTSAWPPTP